MARRPPMTIGRYLVQRLDEIGVGHVFGVPGDYVLTFMDCIVESPIELIGTCNELNAGYAADAYARINRIGAVCVTYAVGGFSVLNAVAGAYAERVPLIVISGGPSLADRRRGLLLHHTLGDFNAQADIFAKVTIASAVLTDAALAPAQIDEILAACLRHKRPVFIEIPEDLVDHPCPRPEPFRFDALLESDSAALAEAVDEAAAMLRNARRPAVLAGVEIHRFRLRAMAQALIERTGYPFATTLLAKSLITEQHPLFVGIYTGALSEGYVQRTVERADCLLNLGSILTDVTLGIYTATLDENPPDQRELRQGADQASRISRGLPEGLHRRAIETTAGAKANAPHSPGGAGARCPLPPPPQGRNHHRAVLPAAEPLPRPAQHRAGGRRRFLPLCR